MTWQPIKTAPKDGTSVLGFWSNGRAAGPRHYGIARYRLGIWVSAQDDEETHYRDPTHWMPLPDPPEATS